MRSMLSSFQDGMTLGRREAVKPRHADPTEATEHRITTDLGSDSAENTDERYPE